MNQIFEPQKCPCCCFQWFSTLTTLFIKLRLSCIAFNRGQYWLNGRNLLYSKIFKIPWEGARLPFMSEEECEWEKIKKTLDFESLWYQKTKLRVFFIAIQLIRHVSELMGILSTSPKCLFSSNGALFSDFFISNHRTLSSDVRPIHLIHFLSASFIHWRRYDTTMRRWKKGRCRWE